MSISEVNYLFPRNAIGNLELKKRVVYNKLPF